MISEAIYFQKKVWTIQRFTSLFAKFTTKLFLLIFDKIEDLNHFTLLAIVQN